MGYLANYLEQYGNLTFKELPFTEVDGIVFSMLSLIDVEACISKTSYRSSFEDVMKKQVYLHKNKPLGLLISNSIYRMLIKASKMKRYQKLGVYNLFFKVNLQEITQSTFFLVDLDDITTIVVYGGTDDTIVGWEEDFSLINSPHAPCLDYASEYINRSIKKSRKYIILGHSKGGMEALYAFAHLDKKYRKNVIKAISYDGVGYAQEIIDEVDESLKEKMTLFVPDGGIVGRLFNPMVTPTIIHSKYHGLNQHDPLSWEIDETTFKRVPNFLESSTSLSKGINDSLSALTSEEKISFVKSLFLVLSSGNATTLSEVGAHPHKAIRSYIHLDLKERKLIASLFNRLAKDKIIAREMLLGFLTLPTTK
jgi:hypothetical protein